MSCSSVSGCPNSFRDSAWDSSFKNWHLENLPSRCQDLYQMYRREGFLSLHWKQQFYSDLLKMREDGNHLQDRSIAHVPDSYFVAFFQWNSSLGLDQSSKEERERRMQLFCDYPHYLNSCNEMRPKATEEHFDEKLKIFLENARSIIPNAPTAIELNNACLKDKIAIEEYCQKLNDCLRSGDLDFSLLEPFLVSREKIVEARWVAEQLRKEENAERKIAWIQRFSAIFAFLYRGQDLLSKIPEDKIEASIAHLAAVIGKTDDAEWMQWLNKLSDSSL